MFRFSGVLAVGLFLIGAMACSAVGAVSTTGTSGAQPPVDAARAKRVEDAKAAFDSLFAEPIRKAKATVTVADDIELAGTLLAAAKTSKNQPELVVLMATAAAEYGSKGPEGFGTAIEAAQVVLELPPEIRTGALDSLAGYCQLIVSRTAGADREKASDQLVAVLVAAGDDRVATGDFGKAVAEYRRAVEAANVIKSGAAADIQAKLQAATLRQGAMARIDALQKQLQANPADATARAELVREYLVEMDSPEQAAKYVDTSTADVRSKLILLAGMTAANLPEAALQQLGEMYAGLADQATPAARPAMLNRAKLYYGTFLDKHSASDIQRIQVELAVKGVDEKIAKLTPKPRMPQGAVLILTFDKSSVIEKAGAQYLTDYSGMGNHGLVHGGTLVKGQAGEALSLDGDRAYVSVPNAPSLRMVGDQTISVWVCPSGSGEGTIFDKRYYCEGAIYYGYTSSGTLTYLCGETTPLTLTSTTYTHVNLSSLPEANVWTHLAVVRDVVNGKITWYKNGKKADEGKCPTTAVRASLAPVQIGYGYSGYFSGKIDEFALYPRALSEREVQTLFDMGSHGNSLSGAGR